MSFIRVAPIRWNVSTARRCDFLLRDALCPGAASRRLAFVVLQLPGWEQLAGPTERASRRQRNAGYVYLPLDAWPLVIQQVHSADKRNAREDQVDIERPAPRQILGQSATEQRTERATRRRDGTLVAERLSTVGGIDEGRREKRKRRGY